MELLKGPEITQKLKKLIEKSSKSVKIASAWLRKEALKEILSELKDNVKLEIVLRASSVEDLKITDCGVFQILEEKRAEIYLSDRLHSKFVIFDDKAAVIGSANLTSAGLNIGNGNIETAIFTENADVINDLLNHFEEIKENSFYLGPSLLGFVINSPSVFECEFLTFKRVKIHSFVQFRENGKDILGEVIGIKNLNLEFPPEFFNFKGKDLENELFQLFHFYKNCERWKEALIFSAESGGTKPYLVKVRILGVKTESGWKSPLAPLQVGGAVLLPSKEFVESFLNRSFSGDIQTIPLEVGFTSDQKRVKVDLNQILGRHLAVLGTTGSGKSYFVKLLLKELSKTDSKIVIHIVDPHGEYGEVLKPFYGKNLKEHILENTLLPLSGDEFEVLLKELGFGYYISGSSPLFRKNRDLIHRFFVPSLSGNALSKAPLKELLSKLDLQGENGKLLELLTGIFGKKTLENQPKVLEALKENLQRETKVNIWNLKRVKNIRSEINVAGLILKELLKKAMKDTIPRLIVVEESHLFAPERGYSELSSGRENFAYLIMKHLAAEGRKFNIGLVIISQRAAQVSKYVLSQANSVALFRTLTVNDLEAYRSYLTAFGGSTLSLLPNLSVGEAVLSGLFVPTTLRVRIKRL